MQAFAYIIVYTLAWTVSAIHALLIAIAYLPKELTNRVTGLSKVGSSMNISDALCFAHLGTLSRVSTTGERKHKGMWFLMSGILCQLSIWQSCHMFLKFHLGESRCGEVAQNSKWASYSGRFCQNLAWWL